MNPSIRKSSSWATRAARLIVGGCLVLSFFSPLISLTASASSEAGAMSCCVGMSSGHCSSGLMAKRRTQVKPEPMCGPKPQAPSDEITVVAYTASNEEDRGVGKNPTSRLTAPSFTTTCPTDCCAGPCAAVRQPKPRQTAGLANAGLQAPLVKAKSNRHSDCSILYSYEALERLHPRGPPVSFC